MSNLTGTWNLDPAHSTINFVVRHAMVSKVRGKFEDFAAQITIDGQNIADSTAEATIQATSVNTGNEDRDNHVRTADFFAVEQYPEITFRSTAFNVDADGNGTVTGELTIKGTTKSIELDVETFGVHEDHMGTTRLGFEATGEIDRTDFGVDFNAPLETGGVLLSKKIKLEIEGSAVKA